MQSLMFQNYNQLSIQKQFYLHTYTATATFKVTSSKASLKNYATHFVKTDQQRGDHNFLFTRLIIKKHDAGKLDLNVTTAGPGMDTYL